MAKIVIFKARNLLLPIRLSLFLLIDQHCQIVTVSGNLYIELWLSLNQKKYFTNKNKLKLETGSNVSWKKLSFFYRFLLLQLPGYNRQRCQTLLWMCKCLPLQFWMQERCRLLLFLIPILHWHMLPKKFSPGNQVNWFVIYFWTKNLLSNDW